MVNNKYFMDCLRNEAGKKNLSDHPVVKFALKDFYNTSMKICDAIDAKDKDGAVMYLKDIILRLNCFLSYAWVTGIITNDDFVVYSRAVDNFAAKEKKNFDDYFKEEVA